MYLLHYIIPVIIFYLNRNKLLFWGLISANLIDLGHVYLRIIGAVPWFSSACDHFGAQCSFNLYPFHNMATLAVASALFIPIAFVKDKRIKFLGYFGLGIIIHLVLDAIHLMIGFGI